MRVVLALVVLILAVAMVEVVLVAAVTFGWHLGGLLVR